MKYTFDRVVRLVIALAVITGLALLVNRLSGVLLPFLVGWLLAYLIHPLVKFVQYKMKVGNRGLSIFISLLFIAIVITGLGFAVVPAISAEIMSMHNAQFAIRNSQLRTKESGADGVRNGSHRRGSWLRRSRRLKGGSPRGKRSCINSIMHALFCRRGRWRVCCQA